MCIRDRFLERAPTPYITVITNVELDHTDYFKSQKQYNQAFVKFIFNKMCIRDSR